MGKEALFPAGQEDGVEFQPLGRMQRHDRHGVHVGILLGVHDQRDVFEKTAQALEGFHRADEFLQVLQPPGRFGRLVVLPHVGVAGLFEDLFGQFNMRYRFKQFRPAAEVLNHVEQRLAGLRLDLVGLDQVGGGRKHGHVAGAGIVMQRADRGVAQAALRGVDDALEGEVVGRLADEAEVSHGIADFEALVEAGAADDAVVEAERHEAVFEFAHLEGGAHEDRHVVQRMLFAVGIAALQPLDLLADGAGFLFTVPGGVDHHLLVVGIDPVGEQRLAEATLVVGDQMAGSAENVFGRAVVTLELDDLGAGKVLFEAQDVVDLRAAPAIDRLVVVADAADVDEAVDLPP